MESMEEEREDRRMSNIVEADYTIVQERTLPVIVSEIKIIEQNVAKTAMEGAIQIGERLQEAKEQVGHGNFDTWCKENLNYNRRTAERFMKIASEYGGENGLISKTTTLSHLSISNALSLLKVPEEDREKFIEEHPVEDMKNKELEEEIWKLKKEKREAEETTESVRQIMHRAENAANELRGEVKSLKEQLAEADPEKAEKMKAKLEKAEEALKKEKEKLKKEKEGRQAAIDKELAEQTEKIRAEAKEEVSGELGDLQKVKDQLEEENRNLQHKLENSGNDTIIRFKVLVDQLQDVFEECGQCILDAEAGTDPDLPGKMNAALRTVVESFKETL